MRSLIKSQPAAKVVTVTKLKGKPHWHFCSNRECRLLYEDRCEEIDRNGRCHGCRGARRPIWVAARDPRECCIGNCTQVLAVEQLVKYALAGPGPWFQCKTCARCHGWNCQ